MKIGKSLTVSGSCGISTAEYTAVNIGEDCMFALNIAIWTHDFHPISYIESGERANPSRSISIGNHVWLADNVTVLSGSEIGDGSVIGYRSIVKSCIPNNCVAIGSPARVVKNNTAWDRSSTYDNSPFYFTNGQDVKNKRYWNKTNQ